MKYVRTSPRKMRRVIDMIRGQHVAEARRILFQDELDRLVDICRARDAQQLWLEVRESNDRARALYQRYGFVPVGVRRDYYPLPPGVPGREDAVVMSLKTATTE